MRNTRNESFTTLLKLTTDREDLVKAFVIERTRQSEENQKDRQTIQRLTISQISQRAFTGTRRADILGYRQD